MSLNWWRSVALSCPTLCNPMYCAMFFPMSRKFSHAHPVSDAIQPSHPLSSPSPPSLNRSQHQGDPECPTEFQESKPPSYVEYAVWRISHLSLIVRIILCDGASLAAWIVKLLLQCRRRRPDPWVGKILWRREWQSTPALLPGEFQAMQFGASLCLLSEDKVGPSVLQQVLWGQSEDPVFMNSWTNSMGKLTTQYTLPWDLKKAAVGNAVCI